MSSIGVELLDHMGSDLTVANAARVSFHKHHKSLTQGDVGLIRYLAYHNHWTPFGHVQLQFRIKAPVFVARQLVKHQVGLVWNEVSRRYVDEPPEFYNPELWRIRAEDKKQGSSDEVLELDSLVFKEYWELMTNAAALYEHMVQEKNIAPEQARMILPQSMMTEWYWTGSLAAFARVVNLRSTPDAQLECRLVANLIDDKINTLYDLDTSWNALKETTHE
jgi:thymidylate synthase (FAD)